MGSSFIKELQLIALLLMMCTNDAWNIGQKVSVNRAIGSVLAGLSVLASPLPAPATFVGAEADTVRIFEKTTPSVAFISTYQEQLNILSMEATEIPRGTGSGFVWKSTAQAPVQDASGTAQSTESPQPGYYIVTNFHVIQNSAGAKVTLEG